MLSFSISLRHIFPPFLLVLLHPLRNILDAIFLNFSQISIELLWNEVKVKNLQLNPLLCQKLMNPASQMEIVLAEIASISIRCAVLSKNDKPIQLEINGVQILIRRAFQRNFSCLDSTTSEPTLANVTNVSRISKYKLRFASWLSKQIELKINLLSFGLVSNGLCPCQNSKSVTLQVKIDECALREIVRAQNPVSIVDKDQYNIQKALIFTKITLEVYELPINAASLTNSHMIFGPVTIKSELNFNFSIAGQHDSQIPDKICPDFKCSTIISGVKNESLIPVHLSEKGISLVWIIAEDLIIANPSKTRSEMSDDKNKNKIATFETINFDVTLALTGLEIEFLPGLNHVHVESTAYNLIILKSTACFIGKMSQDVCLLFNVEGALLKEKNCQDFELLMTKSPLILSELRCSDKKVRTIEVKIGKIVAVHSYLAMNEILSCILPSASLLKRLSKIKRPSNVHSSKKSYAHFLHQNLKIAFSFEALHVALPLHIYERNIGQAVVLNFESLDINFNLYSINFPEATAILKICSVALKNLQESKFIESSNMKEILKFNSELSCSLENMEFIVQVPKCIISATCIEIIEISWVIGVVGQFWRNSESNKSNFFIVENDRNLKFNYDVTVYFGGVCMSIMKCNRAPYIGFGNEILCDSMPWGFGEHEEISDVSLLFYMETDKFEVRSQSTHAAAAIHLLNLNFGIYAKKSFEKYQLLGISSLNVSVCPMLNVLRGSEGFGFASISQNIDINIEKAHLEIEPKVFGKLVHLLAALKVSKLLGAETLTKACWRNKNSFLFDKIGSEFEKLQEPYSESISYEIHMALGYMSILIAFQDRLLSEVRIDDGAEGVFIFGHNKNISASKMTFSKFELWERTGRPCSGLDCPLSGSELSPEGGSVVVYIMNSHSDNSIPWSFLRVLSVSKKSKLMNLYNIDIKDDEKDVKLPTFRTTQIRLSNFKFTYLNRFFLEQISWINEYFYPNLYIYQNSARDLLSGSTVPAMMNCSNDPWIQGIPPSYSENSPIHPKNIEILFLKFEIYIPIGSNNFEGLVLSVPKLSCRPCNLSIPESGFIYGGKFPFEISPLEFEISCAFHEPEHDPNDVSLYVSTCMDTVNEEFLSKKEEIFQIQHNLRSAKKALSKLQSREEARAKCEENEDEIRNVLNVVNTVAQLQVHLDSTELKLNEIETQLGSLTAEFEAMQNILRRQKHPFSLKSWEIVLHHGSLWSWKDASTLINDLKFEIQFTPALPCKGNVAMYDTVWDSLAIGLESDSPSLRSAAYITLRSNHHIDWQMSENQLATILYIIYGNIREERVCMPIIQDPIEYLIQAGSGVVKNCFEGVLMAHLVDISMSSVTLKVFENDFLESGIDPLESIDPVISRNILREKLCKRSYYCAEESDADGMPQHARIDAEGFFFALDRCIDGMGTSMSFGMHKLNIFHIVKSDQCDYEPRITEFILFQEVNPSLSPDIRMVWTPHLWFKQETALDYKHMYLKFTHTNLLADPKCFLFLVGYFSDTIKNVNTTIQNSNSLPDLELPYNFDLEIEFDAEIYLSESFNVEHEKFTNRKVSVEMEGCTLMQWRGLLKSGPGSSRTEANIMVLSLYCQNSTTMHNSSPSLINPIAVLIRQSNLWTLDSGSDTSYELNPSGSLLESTVQFQDKVFELHIIELTTGILKSWGSVDGILLSERKLWKKDRHSLSPEISLYESPLPKVSEISDAHLLNLGNCEIRASFWDINLMTTLFRSFLVNMTEAVNSLKAKRLNMFVDVSTNTLSLNCIPTLRSLFVNSRLADVRIELLKSTIPLANLDLGGARLVFQNSPDSPSGGSIGGLIGGSFYTLISIGYFNPVLYQWEPALEPTPVVASLEGMNKGYFENINISIPHIANVNLTHSGANTIRRALSDFGSQDYEKKETKRSECRVENMLGAPLGLMLNGAKVAASPLRSGTEVGVEVDPSQRDLYANNGREEQGSSMHWTRKHGSLRGDRTIGRARKNSLFFYTKFRSIYYESISPFLIDTSVGMHHIWLSKKSFTGHRRNSSNQNVKNPYPSSIMVIANISLLPDGTRKITLQSRLSIRNDSGESVDICMHSPQSLSTSALRLEVQILPGGIANVPIHFIVPHLRVLSRPSGGSTHWCPLILSLNETDNHARTKGRDSAFAVCAPDLRKEAEVSSMLKSTLSNKASKGVLTTSNWCIHGVVVSLGASSVPSIATERLGSFVDNVKRKVSLSTSSTARAFNINEVGKYMDRNRSSSMKELQDTKLGTRCFRNLRSMSSFRKYDNVDGNIMSLTPEISASDSESEAQFSSDEGNAEQSYANKISPNLDGSECFRLHGSSDDGGGGFIRILEEIDVLQGLRGLLSGVGVDEGGSIDLIEPCQALALTLHSPLVLHNFLCQPLSYRIATREGLISAEGTLPAGGHISIFRIDLRLKHYASFRVLNYSWSTFLRVHSPQLVHPPEERTRNIELKGLRIKGSGGRKEHENTSLSLRVAALGRDIKVFCRLWLVNLTDRTLQYQDSSIGVGLDPTLLGEKFPQVSQDPQGDLNWGYPNRISEVDRKTTTKEQKTPTCRSDLYGTRSGMKSPVRQYSRNSQRSVMHLNDRGNDTVPTPTSPVHSMRSISGPYFGSNDVGEPTVYLPFILVLPGNHFDEIMVEVLEDSSLQDVLEAAGGEGVHSYPASEYSFCQWDDPGGLETSVLAALLRAELDRLSLVDGRIRILKEHLGGKGDGGIPPGVQYTRWDRLGLLLDRYNEIPLETPVRVLSSPKSPPTLRIVHRAEILMSKQNVELYSAISDKEDLSFFSLQVLQFSSGQGDAVGLASLKAKNARLGTEGTPPKSPISLYEWGGAAMFSPPTLGSVQLCVRALDSEWSDMLDGRRPKLSGSSTSCISLKQNPTQQSGPAGTILNTVNAVMEEVTGVGKELKRRSLYCIGVHLGRGKGEFSRTAVLTFVPRYILANNLSDNSIVEYSQEGCEEDWRGVLPPDTARCFHWPYAGRRQLICIRLVCPAQELAGVWEWSGSFRIDTLGTVSLRLRMRSGEGNSLGQNETRSRIVQVKVSLSGASLVVKIKDQDPSWPPYRIDNFTSHLVKIRQLQLQQLEENSDDEAALRNNSGTMSTGQSKSSTSERSIFSLWDQVSPQTSLPYAWDHPESKDGLGTRTLKVCFRQGNKWVEREYKLDEFAEHKPVRLRRSLPNLEAPKKAGELLQKTRGALTETLKRRWVVLKDHVLYIFEDAITLQLRGIIHLRLPGGIVPHISPVRGRKGGGGLDILTRVGEAMDEAVGFVVGDSLISVRKIQDNNTNGDMLRVIAKKLATAIKRGSANVTSLESVGNRRSINLHDNYTSDLVPMKSFLRNSEGWVDLLVETGLAQDKLAAHKLVTSMCKLSILRPVQSHFQSEHSFESNSVHTRSRRVSSELLDLLQLHIPDRDQDLSSSSVSRSFTGFVIESNDESAQSHEFVCGSTDDAKCWIRALRDEVDAAIELSKIHQGSSGSIVSTQSLTSSKNSNFAAESTSETTRTTVRVRVRADGPTKVLELSEEGGEEDDGGVSKGSTQGENEENTTRVLRFNIRGLGISLVDDTPKELIYIYMEGVQAGIIDSSKHRCQSLTIERLQMDNQLPTALYPPVIRGRALGAPSKNDVIVLDGLPPRSADQPPAFHIYSKKLNSDASRGVSYYEGVTMWVRPLDVKLEEALVVKLLRMKARMLTLDARTSQFGTEEFRDSSQNQLILMTQFSERKQHLRDTISAGSRSTGTSSKIDLWNGEKGVVKQPKIYFALMRLHPVDLRLTYKSLPGGDDGGLGNDGMVDVAAISTLAELEGARICLNALQLEHAFGGRGQVLGLVLRHYKLALLSQLGGIVGSFAFLGDPATLLSNISTGVKDLFYEPLEGLKPDGGGFLQGLGRGGQSLVSNTIGGTFNSFDKMTGSVGNTIALLSLDAAYQRERTRQRMIVGDSVADSMTQGAKELGKGIFDGFTGVVMEPLRGAEKEGALGFGKGLVRGVFGVAVKPVVGVFDLSARAFEGIKNVTKSEADYIPSVSDEDGLGVFGSIVSGGALRARPPRLVGPEGLLHIYDWDAAVAQQMIRAVLREDFDVSTEKVRYFRRIVNSELPFRIMYNYENLEAPKGGSIGTQIGSKLRARWVIVTENRIFYLQEEIGWINDKEKSRTMNLSNFGVQYGPGVPPPGGGVRVIWESSLSNVVGLMLVSAGIGMQVSFHKGSLYVKKQEEVVNFRSKDVPIVADSDTRSQVVAMQLLHECLGPEFAQLHMLRPHVYAISHSGWLWRIKESGLLTKRTLRWYVLAGPVLYEYSKTTGDTEDGNLGLYSGPEDFNKAENNVLLLTSIIPLAGIMVSCGKFLGQNNSLRIFSNSQYSSSSGSTISLAVADESSDAALRESTVADIVISADSTQNIQEWLSALSQNIRKEYAAEASEDAGSGDGIYRHVFLNCEGIESPEDFFGELMNAFAHQQHS